MAYGLCLRARSLRAAGAHCSSISHQTYARTAAGMQVQGYIARIYECKRAQRVAGTQRPEREPLSGRRKAQSPSLAVARARELGIWVPTLVPLRKLVPRGRAQQGHTSQLRANATTLARPPQPQSPGQRPRRDHHSICSMPRRRQWPRVVLRCFRGRLIDFDAGSSSAGIFSTGIC